MGFKPGPGRLGKAKGIAVHVHLETNFALSQIAKRNPEGVAAEGFARSVQRIEGFRVLALQVVEISKIVIANRSQPDLSGLLGHLSRHAIVAVGIRGVVQARAHDGTVHVHEGKPLLIADILKQALSAFQRGTPVLKAIEPEEDLSKVHAGHGLEILLSKTLENLDGDVGIAQGFVVSREMTIGRDAVHPDFRCKELVRGLFIKGERIVEIGQRYSVVIHSRQHDAFRDQRSGADDGIGEFVRKQHRPIRQSARRLKIQGVDLTTHGDDQFIDEIFRDGMKLFPVRKILFGRKAREFPNEVFEIFTAGAGFWAEHRAAIIRARREKLVSNQQGANAHKTIGQGKLKRI